GLGNRSGSPIANELLAAADVLVANETEAAALTGQSVATVEEAVGVAARLRVRSEQTVVITLGESGAVLVNADGALHRPAYAVPVRDTTGAGDAFCGAFAVRLVETGDVGEALAWGNAAGGCAVGVPGAEPSLPARASVAALLASASSP
ncbi:MAG: PfkB family carbohydrate kinase, partial [Dehalococcoidia bacterium]